MERIIPFLGMKSFQKILPKTIDYQNPISRKMKILLRVNLFFVLTKKPYDYVDSEIDEDGYYTKHKLI